MSDQSASNRINGGFVSSHGRTKSDETGTEGTVETSISSTQQQEDRNRIGSQLSQDLPRKYDERHVASPAVSDALSRTSSEFSARSASPQVSPRGREPARRLEPPVTKATLSELDVTKIIHNPKLRHDINFDPELHFRPNLDGEKGRRKQEKANQFWNALQEQLIQFVVDREGFVRDHGTEENWCLPLLLKAVKEIIQTLVPARDREFLNEGLNVDLLMQQFNRGIADLEKLAQWLASVLKLHCAPMRDEWVDEMYSKLSRGNRNNDMGELVKGMCSLLGVLEAMKLDVANHQIRCLRPHLIEDTVLFEQRFFCKKIQSGRLDIRPAKQWYSLALSSSSAAAPTRDPAFGDAAPFFRALAALVMPSAESTAVPSTFLFDEERLLKLDSRAERTLLVSVTHFSCDFFFLIVLEYPPDTIPTHTTYRRFL